MWFQRLKPTLKPQTTSWDSLDPDGSGYSNVNDTSDTLIVILIDDQMLFALHGVMIK